MANGDVVTLYSPTGKPPIKVSGAAVVDAAVKKGWSKTPIQPKAPAAPKAAPAPVVAKGAEGDVFSATGKPTDTRWFRPGSYSYEIPAGIGRMGKGMYGFFTKDLPESAKPRGDATVDPQFRQMQSSMGPVGRAFYNQATDLIAGVADGKAAREKAKAGGESLAGQILAQLENTPILGGFTRKAEEAGPGYFKLAPETTGAFSELMTLRYGADAVEKVGSKAAGLVKPEALRDRAAKLNTEITKSAKVTRDDPKGTAAGLRMAQEQIKGTHEQIAKDADVASKQYHAKVEKGVAALETQKATFDASADIKGIIAEIKNQKAQRGVNVQKPLDKFVDSLMKRPDGSVRDWTKMSPKEWIELTRHDGLLSTAASFAKEDVAKTAVENAARRVVDAGNDKLATLDPDIVKNRTAESQLIRVRDGARDAQKKALDGSANSIKSIFRSGKAAIGLYVGLKMMGVSFAEAYAIPLLLFATANTVKNMSARAAMYARAADWVDALVNGRAKPGQAYQTGFSIGQKLGGRGTPNLPQSPAGGPATPPTAPSGHQGPSAAPSATSAQSAPVSGAGATVTAAPTAAAAVGLAAPGFEGINKAIDVASNKAQAKMLQEHLATMEGGEKAAAPGSKPVTHATPKPTEAPKVAPAVPKAEPTVTKVPEGVSGLSPKAQKLFTEIDELLSKKAKTGAEKEFQARRAKEIQLELKEAKLTPEETKQLQGAFKLSPERRAQVREAQRTFRAKAASEVATSQGAVAAGGAPEGSSEAGSGATRQAVGNEPTGEHVVIRIDSAYKTIMAEYPEAAGMVAELKKQAKAAKVNGTHMEATAAEEALDMLRSAGKE